MTCEVCGNDRFRTELVSDLFRVEDRVVIVENIPAEVCTRCGEANFSARVAEHVRRMVHGPHQAERVVSAEVLAYRAA